MADIILVSYSGYIKTPSSLALDNGLANLAGALRAAGHTALIEDYNTLDVLAEMTPDDLRDRAASLFAPASEIAGGAVDSARKKRALFEDLQQSLAEKQRHGMDRLYARLCARIHERSPLAVGFKCWGSEGALAIRDWCQRLRRDFPRLRILLGGPICEVMPEHAARFIGDFDLMATCEAERSIPAMIEHLEGRRPLEKVPGILYRDSQGRFRKTPPELIENLDELPFPDYSRETYPSAWDGSKLNMVIIDESRGCPMSCSFCVHPTYAGQWRFKSPRRIADELQAIQRLLGTRFFRLAGSNTPHRLLVELAREVLARGIDARFSCFMHLNGLRIEDLPLLRQAGLRCVFFGVESGDPELLRAVANKRITPERASEVLRATSKHGIFATASFIFPLPHETEASRANTLAFLRREFSGNPHASAQMINPFPLPQTEWWRERDRFGFDFDEDELLMKTITLPVRHLFPPELQDFLPYSVNGKPHRELARELSELMSELKDDDLIFNVSDDVAIIAAGCRMPPGRFRESLLPAFISGDLPKIRRMVEVFNAQSAMPAVLAPIAQAEAGVR